MTMKKAEISSRDAFRMKMAAQLAENTSQHLGQPVPPRLQILIAHFQANRISAEQFKMLVDDWGNEQGSKKE
jgi:hypothetical protein